MNRNLTRGDIGILDDSDFKPWKNLAYAIVLRAAEDYERYLRTAYRQMNLKGKIEPMTLSKIADCERFFRGQWMYELTGDVVTGDHVMKAVRKRVKKWADKRAMRGWK